MPASVAPAPSPTKCPAPPPRLGCVTGHVDQGDAAALLFGQAGQGPDQIECLVGQPVRDAYGSDELVIAGPPSRRASPLKVASGDAERGTPHPSGRVSYIRTSPKELSERLCNGVIGNIGEDDHATSERHSGPRTSS